ncbi:putative serine protease K12H4.7 [Helicoverpa zea]|uniref:putative serine protease K12H4.7 n=1 Tax=Helicoverpa zea TaxID=7113 RepID=UPI001F5AD23D|nr:putative serine protease K12H4.7 [Helicoverpa zea]
MIMYFSRVKILILLYVINQVYGFIHLRHENLPCLCGDSPTFWIEQPLDHFNETDQRTFKMKYHKILDFWKPGGPIVFYMNGEDRLDCSRAAMINSSNQRPEFRPVIDQIVEDTGAALFKLEHRYYGDSTPNNDLSTENLAYLSSRQALADAAHLLVTIKESPDFKDSKVIVIGGSYAGNLAAWMKLLYPTLVDAALASSAPVLAKANFNEYYEQVTDTFKKYRPHDCINRTIEKFNTFRELLKTPEGIKNLKKQQNICENTDMTILENQQLFFEVALNIYAIEAQYGKPDEPSAACKMNLSFADIKHNRFNMGKSNDCFDFDYNEHIKAVHPKHRSWYYQTCTEFGYFQTVESNKTMFGNILPVDYYYKNCKDLYGVEFDEERVKQGVIKTNKIYGGLTPNVTNVVFTNGDMDPWHRISVLHDLSPDAPSIYIEGASHCADQSYPYNTENKNITAARIQIVKLLKKWIGVA